jgi:hypothetical protein
MPMTIDSNDIIDRRAKFDLGTPPPSPRLDHATVPWAYGTDRIAALVRSPDSLYLYWEITDDGIAAARRALGVGPSDGWYCLRIYDTTGRNFDGLNAHHHVDADVDRTARSRFMTVGRPGSSAHVDIGVKTHDGRFFPIARSGRADFPRRSPSPNTSVDWMTVTDHVDRPAARPYRSRYAGVVPQPGSHARSQAHDRAPQGAPPAHSGTETWRTEHTERRTREWHVAGETHGEWFDGGALESRKLVELLEHPWLLEQWRTEWRGGVQFLSWATDPTGVTFPGEGESFGWQLGPFPVDAERVHVDLGGTGPIVMNGTSRDWGPVRVYGPWKVTIRGFESRPARRVLASWTMHWVRSTPPIVERWFTGLERRRVGAFEREEVILGASEGVRLREIGGSEVWRIGASERHWLGASAWMQLGASEVLAWGASELARVGASALTWRGGSEWLLGGASERASLGSSAEFGGASPWLALGASNAWSATMLGASDAWSGTMLGTGERVSSHGEGER